jgi:hypothetical protein
VRYSTRPLSAEAQVRLAGSKPTRSPFSAAWGSTSDLLDKELRLLGASDVVLQVDIDEADFRIDGQPRANARRLSPGVAISFTTRNAGDLMFTCGRFSRWEDNVRAIALGLEALRTVERYGIVQSDEQYRGWQALPPGTPMPAAKMTVEEAVALLREQSGWRGAFDPYADRIHIDVAYRGAAKRNHPDQGGDPEMFRRITEARDLLKGAL